MFLHQHPYPPFITENTTKLIVGTLPPPRFSTGEFKEGDVDFCYGSRDGQLWQILNRIFKLNLVFETTDEAVQQRKDFLLKYNIGVCDIVASAERAKIDASDLGMTRIKCRDLVGYLKQYPKIDTLLFTGGNSKNGPEYLFRRHLKDYGLKLNALSDEVPRIHELKFDLEMGVRRIKTVSLIAPSGAANRAVGAIPKYKTLKKKNPEFNTIDFRVLQYAEYF
ncbi:uracil-DNA glycosylase family protein [Galbibacter sp. EGI 63066]|uniref:uracil-DNA glycosylase family protein n=1 Tax=Galbibacter sp. EGI 63066 TaxID=2993559 RepID=UPI002248A707|nr:uracil-DNA glycosylase family protein [Galbibacter sp. EGI 63066]MCX2679687.1 uracil-DNA glycosylase family protein [Galbibacter sp. EGI 63066]